MIVLIIISLIFSKIESASTPISLYFFLSPVNDHLFPDTPSSSPDFDGFWNFSDFLLMEKLVKWANLAL